MPTLSRSVASWRARAMMFGSQAPVTRLQRRPRSSGAVSGSRHGPAWTRIPVQRTSPTSTSGRPRLRRGCSACATQGPASRASATWCSALARPDRRHHRHRRQDHDHVSRRRNPRAAGRDRDCEAAARGRQPLADRRFARPPHRPDTPPTRSHRPLLLLELTSSHLAFMRTTPTVAAVISFWPDHLELHGSLARYRAAKETIVRSPGPQRHRGRQRRRRLRRLRRDHAGPSQRVLASRILSRVAPTSTRSRAVVLVEAGNETALGPLQTRAPHPGQRPRRGRDRRRGRRRPRRGRAGHRAPRRALPWRAQPQGTLAGDARPRRRHGRDAPQDRRHPRPPAPTAASFSSPAA